MSPVSAYCDANQCWLCRPDVTPCDHCDHGLAPSRSDQILAFIREHTEAKGYPPTTREIGEAVGLSSPSTVHRWLDHLVAQGRISHHPKSPRTITLNEEAS